MKNTSYFKLLTEIENKVRDQSNLKKARFISYPYKSNVRWLVRVDKTNDFWKVLVPNGWRGRIKKIATRYLFPIILWFKKSIELEISEPDYIYTGVNDGKRSFVVLKILNNNLLIRKYFASDNSECFHNNETYVLNNLNKNNSDYFPILISSNSKYIEILGQIPYQSFNPKSLIHRDMLVEALTRLYRSFELKSNENGLIMCMSHNDLNKWNMFISINQMIHIFDFETATYNLLGFDVFTTFRNEVSHSECESFFVECFSKLAINLGIKNLDPVHYLKIIEATNFAKSLSYNNRKNL
jgi:hypothetical protein